MNRGCTTADVVKAIYYLIDQKYETGQALPVTGGQVMLSADTRYATSDAILAQSTRLHPEP